MACLRRPYAICLLILFIFLAEYSFGQTTPLLRVDEEQIKFRLNSHPVLEMPIVNTSDKALVGDFRLELLDTNSKVESFVTGTFQGKPGTTVEKVEWPLAYLVTTSPSSLGWRRLHYSFVPRSELGFRQRKDLCNSAEYCWACSKYKSRPLQKRNRETSSRCGSC